MEKQFPDQRDVPLSIFDGDDELEQHDRALYRQGVRKARNALFFAGGIMFTVDMVLILMQRDQLSDIYLYSIIGVDALVLAAFIGLGLWTKKKPYTAILIGLILFCALQIFAMVTDPTNIYKGLIVKAVVIVTLVTGLKKAKALQQLDNRSMGKFE